MRRQWALATVAFSVLAVTATRCHPPKPANEFSEREVAQINAELAKLNPSSYRIVLPVFSKRTYLGSETIGSLPVSEVRRIASLRGVTLPETANMQVILVTPESGGGGGKDGNTPGSHVPAFGRAVIDRIALVASRIDKSRYVLIH